MIKYLIVIALSLSKLDAMDLQLSALPSRSELHNNRFNYLPPNVKSDLKYILIRDNLSSFISTEEQPHSQSALPSKADCTHNRFKNLPRDVQRIIRFMILRNHLPSFIKAQEYVLPWFNATERYYAGMSDCSSVSLSDSACCALVGNLDRARIFDLTDKKNPKTVDVKAQYVALTSDGRYALTSYLHKVAFFDLADKANPKKISEFNGDKIILTPDGHYSLVTRDKVAVLYDMTSIPTSIAELPAPFKEEHRDLNQNITSIELTPDAQFALIATFTNVRLWDLRDKKNPSFVDIYSSRERFANHACLSGDAKFAFLGFYNEIDVLDLTEKNNPVKKTTLKHKNVNGAFSTTPDAHYAATVSGKVGKVWDLSNKSQPKIIGRFDGHNGNSGTVTLSSDACSVLSAGGDVRLWQLNCPGAENMELIDLSLIVAENNVKKACVEKQECKPSNVELESEIESLDVTDDARYALVSIGNLYPNKYVVNLLDFNNRKEPKVVAQMRGLGTVITADGRYALVKERGDLYVLYDLSDKSQPKKIKEWKGDFGALTSDGNYALTITDNIATVYKLPKATVFLKFPIDISRPLVGPQIKFAITSDAKLVILGLTDEIKLWDLTNQLKPQSSVFPFVTNQRVNCLSLTPRGDFVLFGMNNGAELWDLTDKQKPKKVSQLNYDHRLSSVSLTDDARYALTTDEKQSAFFWDLTDKNKPHLIGKLQNQYIREAKITADARYALFSETRKVTLWPLVARAENCSLMQVALMVAANRMKVNQLQAEMNFNSEPTSLALDDNANYAFIGSSDDVAHLVDLTDRKDPKILAQVPGKRTVLTPDARYALAVSKGRATWYDISNKLERVSFAGECIAFAPLACYALAATGKDATLYNLLTKRIVARISRSSDIMGLDITPDARYALIITGKNVTFFDITNEEDAIIYEHTSRYSMQTIPDNICVMTSDANFVLFIDRGCAQLWDLTDKKSPKCRSIFGDQSHTIVSVALTDNANYALTLVKNATITLWDLSDKDNPTAIETLDSSIDNISDIKLTRNGRYILAGSQSKKLIKLWSINPDEKKQLFIFNELRRRAAATFLND